MADFPSDPVPPKEFMEQFVPQLFADTELPDGAAAVEVQLGVKLDGDGGGEWIVRLAAGGLSVEAGERHAAAFTIIQTVEDWRGALWEGRGGVFGKTASALFRGEQAAGAGEAAGAAAAPNAAALGQLAALDGVIQIVVTGGEGGDWSTAFKLGPGEIPEEPTTKVTVTAEDAAALESGELDPMQAFMSGKIQIAGDMALMMQMQAISMQGVS